ncbi:MAG: DUF2304 domain-containing protein [Desulfobacterales bacterium]|nr:DUF2304 domain-containing protein [Desulfobacterales bacterium]
MTFQQKIFAVITCFFIFVTVIHLVKKGNLREEFSWIWLLTNVVLLVMVLWYDLLVFFTKLIGAVLPTTTLFIFGIIFLILVSLHLAIKVSVLTGQVKNLAQKVSLLETHDEEN